MLPRADDIHRLLTAEIARGERLLWSSQPDPSLTMLSKWAVIPFAMFWLLIGVRGLVQSLHDGNAALVAFVSVFVALGAYILFLPVIEYIGARRTIFGITENRLIVVRRNGRSVKSVLLSGVTQVERIRKWQTVTLRIPTALVSDGDGGQKIDYLDLHGLKDGERAYRLLTGNSQPMV